MDFSSGGALCVGSISKKCNRFDKFKSTKVGMICFVVSSAVRAIKLVA